MAKLKTLICVFMGLIMITGCDLSVPDKPDFTTSHTVEVPLINEKSYVFLGDSTGALIDSTSEDLDSLFIVDPNSGLISITSEEDFDFGDLDDAIPEIDGSSTSFNSEVGELEIGNFSSGSGDLGTTNFDAINGPAPQPAAGTPVPAGNNSALPVEINIGNNTDFFTSATIRDGALDITVTNELGFDITTLEITLLSDGSAVGTPATFNNLTDDATETASVTFSEGDELSNISIDVVITWDAFTYPADAGDLIVNAAEGNNLFASSVTANLEPQDFSTASTSTFSDTEFRFTDASHYVELSAGQISVANLINDMGIGIETLQISFPGIRSSANLADSLVVNYDPIPRNSTAPDQNIDLAGFRIYALNNEVSYNIVAATENTQSGPSAGSVTISETDQISADVDISGLTVGTAFGIVLEQRVLLGDNDTNNDGINENIDVFNDTEAEITEIDGLDDFSDQIDGFKFTSPIININYNSNIQIPTTIYGVLVGTDADGNTVYLNGKPGSPNEVEATDPIDGLLANGVQLDPENLIKFSIDTNSDCVNNTCQISFNTTTTNVDDFLNNLPSSIRFIGRGVINEDENETTITTPLEFSPMLAIDLPLAFSTEVGAPASFTDSLDFELDLGDDTDVAEAQMFIRYTNNLPLGLNIFLSFQDTTNLNSPELFSLPNPGNELRMVASPVDAMGFATGGQVNNSFMLMLTDEQTNLIKNANLIEYSINLRSSDNQDVKLRASDSIVLSLGARITIENKVGGN